MNSKSYLSLFGRGEEDDHLIREKNIANLTYSIEKKVTYQAKKTGRARPNGRFGKE